MSNTENKNRKDKEMSDFLFNPKYEKYHEKINLFCDLIDKKYFSNHNLIWYGTKDDPFEKITSFIFLTRDKHKSILVEEKEVFEFTTWKDIKLCIEKFLNIEYECKVCFEEYKYDDTSVEKINCPKCSEPYCLECYIKIIKSNKGILKCPFCCHNHGKELPDFYVDIFINDIIKDWNIQKKQHGKFFENL